MVAIYRKCISYLKQLLARLQFGTPTLDLIFYNQTPPPKYKLKTTTKTRKRKNQPQNKNKGGTLVIYERHKLISKSDISNSFYNL